MNTDKKIILDLNKQFDNMIALQYLLNHPNADVVGVTTCFGGGSPVDAGVDALKLLRVVNKNEQIPVVLGASNPLFREETLSLTEFANSHVLEKYELHANLISSLQNDMASDFIVEKVNEYTGEITVITAGSLTNLATAFAKDPLLHTKVKELIVLGGTIKAPGDVTSVSEKNISLDPEAAHMVFAAGFPLTMVGLDVSTKAILSKEAIHNLNSNHHTEIMNLIIEYVEGFGGKAILKAPLAAAICLEDRIVEKEEIYVQIETKGNLSRGATVADLRMQPKEILNVSACMNVNKDLFIDLLTNVLSTSTMGESK